MVSFSATASFDFGPHNRGQSSNHPSLPQVDDDITVWQAPSESCGRYTKVTAGTEASRGEARKHIGYLDSTKFNDLLGQLAAEFSDLHSQHISMSSELAQLRNEQKLHGSSSQELLDLSPSAKGPQEHVLEKWCRFAEMLCPRGAADRAYSVRDCWIAASNDEVTNTSHTNASSSTVSSEFSALDNAIFVSYGRLRAKGHWEGSGLSMHAIPSLMSTPGSRFLKTVRCRCKMRARPLLIHPSSHIRLAWSLMSLLMILYDFSVFSIELFEDLDANFVNHMKSVSVSFWCADIVVSFLTAVYIDGELCTDFKQIARHYIMTWFAFDLLCTVPAFLPFFKESKSTDAQFTSVLRTLRFFRSARIVRVAKLRHLATTILKMSNSVLVHLFARSFGSMLFLGMFIHGSGCIWFILGKQRGGWVIQRGILDEDPLYQYLASVHWAASQLQGSTDIIPGNTLGERLFAVASLITSIVALATFVSTLTSLNIDISQLSKRYRDSEAVRSYFRKHHVSYDIQLRVRSYLEMSRHKISLQQEDQDELAVLKHLPASMRRQVVNEANSWYLASNPVFLGMQECNKRCLERICCDALRSLWMIPDENVFNFGDVAIGMYFVGRGKLDYLRYPAVLRNIAIRGKLAKSLSSLTKQRQQIVNLYTCQDCDYLAEAVLWTRWVHCGDFIAHNHASLYALHLAEFISVVSAYAFVYEAMSKHALLFVSVLNTLSGVEMSDVFGSMEALEEDERRHPIKKMQRMKFKY